MKLLAWNIQQGGARRSSAIIDVINRHSPNILVLTELRPSSKPLLTELATQGWSHQVTGINDNPIGSVGIIARVPIFRLPSRPQMQTLPGRWLEASVPTYELTISGVYGPLKNEPYHSFWRNLVNALSAETDEDYVLAGDLNTGQSLCDAPDPKFICSEFFMELKEKAKLVDIWRKYYPDGREYSFHHRLGGGVLGAGFRIDHILASPSLALRAVACSYDHDVRLNKVSDHSPLWVEFD